MSTANGWSRSRWPWRSDPPPFTISSDSARTYARSWTAAGSGAPRRFRRVAGSSSTFRPSESGVVLRVPPHSKRWCRIEAFAITRQRLGLRQSSAVFYTGKDLGKSLSEKGARLCRRPAAGCEDKYHTPGIQNRLRLVEDDTAALRVFQTGSETPGKCSVKETTALASLRGPLPHPGRLGDGPHRPGAEGSWIRSH